MNMHFNIVTGIQLGGFPRTKYTILQKIQIHVILRNEPKAILNNLLDSHPPFLENWGGGGNLLLFSTHWDTSIFCRYLVKGRYCACSIAITFVGVACNNWDGRDENQLSYICTLYGLAGCLLPECGLNM
jgi:hypothetical protein